jgi:hypothetical protein
LECFTDSLWCALIYVENSSTDRQWWQKSLSFFIGKTSDYKRVKIWRKNELKIKDSYFTFDSDFIEKYYLVNQVKIEAADHEL